LTGDDRDAARLDEAFQALELLGDDALAVRRDTGDVDGLEARGDTDGGRGAHMIGDFGRVQQRLRRDAAAVQAGAADLVLLDQGDFLAEIAGAQRGRVAAAASAEDDEVELVNSHQASLTDARAKATSERTATPVGPFSVKPYGEPLCSEEPAMSRCTQGMGGASSASDVRPMNRCRNNAANLRPPERSDMLELIISAICESSSSSMYSGSASAQACSPTRSAAARYSATAASSPITPVCRIPRATMIALVSVA